MPITHPGDNGEITTAVTPTPVLHHAP